jgi:hypothetical protein
MTEFSDTDKKIIFEALDEWREKRGYRHDQIEYLYNKLRVVL